MDGVADLTTSDEEKAAGVPSKEQGLHDAGTELTSLAVSLPNVFLSSLLSICSNSGLSNHLITAWKPQQ